MGLEASTSDRGSGGGRDLSAGGLFLVVISCLAFIISSALPAWWMTTIELEGSMCTCGTGLWQANYTWGDHIRSEDLFGEGLTCSSSNVLVTQERCDADFEGQGEARRRGRVAGVFSLLAVAAAGAAVFYAYQYERAAGKLGFFAACAATLCQLISMWVFTDSPVFKDLSYYFGCHFEFVHALNSNWLVCHAVGPGWAVGAVGLIFCSVGSVMLYFAYNPTTYVAPSTGRYSLFAEMFERHNDVDYVLHTKAARGGPRRSAILMAANEHALPVDDSSSTRRFFRAYGVPVLCIANFALFLYSNMSTGATVEPHITLVFPKWLAIVVEPVVGKLKHGDTLEFRDDVFNFTLVSSLRHFYDAGAFWLAFLIGGFSGVWPYTKIFVMLMLWFVPASERLRGRALHWIDVLGKWSLIDSFFLCLMAVGFGFNTSVEILGIQVSVQILVRPGWGVYSFVLATIASLALSHYLTYLHQGALERRRWTPSFLTSMKRPPHETLQSRPYAPFPKRRRFKCRAVTGSAAVWFFLVLTFCVTLSGQLTPTFEFQFGGLATLILPKEKQINEYSLVHVGQRIPDAAREGGYLSGEGWNWFLAIQFFFLAMIVPLLRVCLLMVLWFTPMTLKTARRVYNLAQIASAWSALDVFLISIIAATLEIGILSSEVISSAFGPVESVVCELLTSLPPKVLNSILHAVGLPSLDLSSGCTLFRVDAVLKSGCWVLLVAIVLLEFTSTLVMEMCEASLSERMAMLSAYHRAKNGGASPLRAPRSESSQQQNALSHPLLNASSSSNLLISPDDEAAALALQQEDDGLLGAEGLEDSASQGMDPDTLRSSRNLRRLLSAQELGSEEFVGSFFDFFYGPFPRSFWPVLVRLGLMRRVEWDEIGEELHESLVPASPAARVHSGGETSSAHGSLSAALLS